MAKAKINSTYEMETNDGGKIKLTLAYKYLYRLRSTNKQAYDDYNNVMTKGVKDEFDSISILYAAYLCQCIEDDVSEPMSFDDFLDVLPFDRVVIAKTVGMLIAPKKTMDSADLS